MRFETDVLTFDACEQGCCRDYCGAGEEGDNFACQDDILSAGWILPSKASCIVLVFSTMPIAGASTCWASRLHYAGRVAMEKSGLNHTGRLWWWPMIVTEAPS